MFSVSFYSCDFRNDKTPPPKDSSAVIQDGNKGEELLSLIGVGDIMLGSNYPNSSSLPPDDGRYILDGVSEILEDADITTGNLEGCFLDRGGTPKKCDSSDNCHSFRMPVRYASYLKDAGFDYLSLANNHSGDMGVKGRESTYETLQDNGIHFAGTFDYPSVIIEKDGLKIGITSFAPNRGCLNLNDIDDAAEIVSGLDEKCDIVIVWFHGGAEGSSAQRVPKRTEYYLGEKRGDVYEFAHAVIDAGADIVFGSGPHVTRAVELYNNRFIAYSLGNFCTYRKFGLSGMLGICPVIKVYVNNKGEFVKGSIVSVKQIKRGFPVTDESDKALQTIIRLTKSDFPDTPLEITPSGEIIKK